ncbi:MAG: ribonuclease Z [Anaerolineae bacterium]|nr:ribonuclease Z [Anaerolineae bacterium]
MFEIVFLGTSASAPSARRNLPSLLVKHDEYRFLVDCGEGTQRQILQAGIGFKRMNKILITHGHLDHILGLAGLISTFMRWEAIEDIEIMAGKSALERIHDLVYGVVLRGTKTPMPIRLTPISPGIIFDGGDFFIEAFPVQHRGPDNLGYKFQEKGRRPFLPEKADQLGIPPGPWRRDLVDGSPVVLPDGRRIQPDEVLGDYRPGTLLVVVGDSGETASLVEHVRGADALVIESTYLEEETELAAHFAHLTARQAAELAQQAGVRRLYLTHFSRRYREKDILQEAQAIFPNTIAARDFDAHMIRHEDEKGDVDAG